MIVVIVRYDHDVDRRHFAKRNGYLRSPGRKPERERVERITAQPLWTGKQFRNASNGRCIRSISNQSALAEVSLRTASPLLDRMDSHRSIKAFERNFSEVQERQAFPDAQLGNGIGHQALIRLRIGTKPRGKLNR